MPSRKLRTVAFSGLAALAVLGLPLATPARGLPLDLHRPGEHVVHDLADLITDRDLDAIRQVGAALLRDKDTPLVVVTIDSMAKYGGQGLRIESFARRAFDQWSTAEAKHGGRPWNTGILLLVSRGDRKARIQLGGGWPQEKDAECHQIMDEQIIPHFKRGDFSGGIRAGVEALDRMARGEPQPEQATAWWVFALLGAFFALAFTSFVSLAQSGKGGWGWVMWSIVFGILGYLLVQMLTGRRRYGYSDGYDDGWSGGGIDGGGGGGATGSW